MSYEFHKVFHIIMGMVLLGYTFYAFAAPPETRKRVMMITGIASLLILVSGVGIMHKVGYTFGMKWIWVKIAVWLVLSAMAGLAYRKREIAGPLRLAVIVLAGVSVYMAIYKPF
jgi:hypothetical protein